MPIKNTQPANTNTTIVFSTEATVEVIIKTYILHFKALSSQREKGFEV
jgi:hypothetical protein